MTSGYRIAIAERRHGLKHALQYKEGDQYHRKRDRPFGGFPKGMHEKRHVRMYERRSLRTDCS